MEDIKSKCAAVVHQLQDKYADIEAPLKTAWAELVAVTMKCKMIEEETQGKLNEFTKNNKPDINRAYTMLVLTQLIELAGVNLDNAYVLIPFEDEVNSILSSIVVPPHNAVVDLDPDIVTFVREHIRLDYNLESYLTMTCHRKLNDDDWNDAPINVEEEVTYHEGETELDIEYNQIKPHLCTYAVWMDDLERRRDQQWERGDAMGEEKCIDAKVYVTKVVLI